MLLRIAAIIILSLMVVWMCRGIWWIATPLWSGTQADNSILVEPFDFVQGDKVEKNKGDVVAQLVATRIRQIEEVLAKKPDLSRFAGNPSGATAFIPEDSVGGKVEANVIKSAPLAIPRDLELKVYGVDVAGVLGLFRDQLHEGPRLKGLLKVGADKHELLLTLQGADLGANSWMLSDGTLQGAIESISHQFVHDTRKRGNPQLASLSLSQFVAFVKGVDLYHSYLQNHQTSTTAGENRTRLQPIKDVLVELVTTKPRSSLPYIYLASVTKLLDEKEINEPLRLYRLAAKLAPDNAVVQEQIRRLEAAKATPAAVPQAAATLDTIRQQEAFKAINLPAALNAVKAQREVTVAILATGIDPTQAAFSKRIVAAQSFVPGERASTDRHGYGTHIASVVLAAAPQAKIIDVKVLAADGSGKTSNIVEGMEFAAQSNADIVLLSFGGADVDGAVFKNVIAALSHHEILFIAPAGNDGSEAVFFPAAIDGVLSVGAIDLAGERAAFSNHGNKVRIFAPGVGVIGLRPENKSEAQSGTSVSAAIVTGVAALVLSANKNLKQADLPKVLLKSAKTTSDMKVIDAPAALEAAGRWPN